MIAVEASSAGLIVHLKESSHSCIDVGIIVCGGDLPLTTLKI